MTFQNFQISRPLINKKRENKSEAVGQIGTFENFMYVFYVD